MSCGSSASMTAWLPVSASGVGASSERSFFRTRWRPSAHSVNGIRVPATPIWNRRRDVHVLAHEGHSSTIFRMSDPFLTTRVTTPKHTKLLIDEDRRVPLLARLGLQHVIAGSACKPLDGRFPIDECDDNVTWRRQTASSIRRLESTATLVYLWCRSGERCE